MINETLNKYCKYKKIKLSGVRRNYILTKKDVKVATINIDNKVKIEYENGKEEEIDKEEFQKELNKELKQMRLLRRFKATSRPIKWQKSQHRNKLTEMGRVNLRGYVYRQNLRNSEAYSIKELSK